MPNSDDPAWHDALPLADLDDSEPRDVRLSNRSLVLVRIGETIHAVDGICTHSFALLSDGYVDGSAIECPLHAARFDLSTGRVLDGPAETDLDTYPVRLSGAVVQVGLPVARD